MLRLKDISTDSCLLELAGQSRRLAPPASVDSFVQLMRTSTSLAAAFASVHDSHRLAHGKIVVLLLLSHEPHKAQSPANLADWARISRATMTGILARLQRAGLIRREPFPADRRMLLVRLTAKGRRHFDRLVPDYLRRIAASMRPLSLAEQKTLARLLAKIEATVPSIIADLPARARRG